MTVEEKLRLVEELRNDPEVIKQIKRNLEARRRGDRIHWDDVKGEC